MKQGNRIGLAAVLVCVFTPSLLADTIFNFEDLPAGTSTPFTETVNGLGASFSSDAPPFFGFIVTPSNGEFETLTGNVLGQGEFGGTLTIDFSAPQTSISMNFAAITRNGMPVPIYLTAFNGASEVGSASATGVVPPGFIVPEGVLSFSGPAFDSVLIDAPPASSFVIDNVTVAAVPEPGTAGLLAVGLGLVTLVSRLRRSNRYASEL